MILGRGLFGSGLVAFLLLMLATASLAQGSAPTPLKAAPAQAKPAHAAAQPKPAKPVPKREAAKKPEAVKKTAAASKKPEAKRDARKVATAKPQAKKPEAKKLAAGKQPAAAPAKVASASPKPLPPEYTITTTRNHVTYSETRVVPVATASAVKPTAPVAKVAAAPVTVATPAPQPQPRATAAVKPAPLPAPAAEAPPTATQVAALPVSVTASAPPRHDEPPPATTTGKPGDPNAASFVATFLRDAFRIARSAGTTSLQRRAQLADLFSGKMDIGRIAGYTTSDTLTATAPDFQQRFRTILISYLVETYYPRLELASDPSIKVETVAGSPLADGTAVVWTIFTKEGWGSQSVQWHLAAESGGYRVVDIMSAGASVVQMERDTFRSVMRDGGLPELMAKLDARTKSLAMAATE